MKFDFIIGNPPYNQEAQKTSTSDDPVYHSFMDETYKISDKVLLITPARFLMNAGKTPSSWNKKMLADKHLKVEYYEVNSMKIFPSASIPGGIVITYHDLTKNFGAIGEFVNFPELGSIDNKVKALCDKTIDSIMYTQSKFDLDTLYKDFPEMKNQIGSNGKDKRFRQIIMERFPNIFTETEIVPNSVRVLGLIDKKRSYRFIDRKYVEKTEWLDNYKVFVPFSNGTMIGETPVCLIGKPVIGIPGDGITQTFIGIGSFPSENEAQNLLKYVSSKFARALLGILKVTQGNKPETWSHVPMQDFTSSSDIDWSKPVNEIDQQLFSKYGLNKDEIEFIESHVKEMN